MAKPELRDAPSVRVNISRRWRCVRTRSVARDRERDRRQAINNPGCPCSLKPGQDKLHHVENFFANTVAAARKYHIAHEILDAEAIRAATASFVFAMTRSVTSSRVADSSA